MQKNNSSSIVVVILFVELSMACFAEVVVGLDRANYQVNKGETLMICVNLVSGQILDGISVSPVIGFTPEIGKRSSILR